MKNIINSVTVLTANTKTYLLMVLTAIISAIIFLFAGSETSASGENAKIIFTEESYDFRKVKEGPVLEYSFRFTNEGDTPLVIEKVQTSCRCTDAATDGKKEYGKGEGSEIKITFNSQGRKGTQEKHVAVFTNETKNKAIDLIFTCDIVS